MIASFMLTFLCERIPSSAKHLLGLRLLARFDVSAIPVMDMTEDDAIGDGFRRIHDDRHLPDLLDLLVQRSMLRRSLTMNNITR